MRTRGELIARALTDYAKELLCATGLPDAEAEAGILVKLAEPDRINAMLEGLEEFEDMEQWDKEQQEFQEIEDDEEE